MNNPRQQLSSACLTCNADPAVLTNDAAERFIGHISDELQKGYGFVPFIGAGFSAPSGVPLVNDIKSYLERCIALALGLDAKGMRPWSPRTDKWPPFTDGLHRPRDYWLTQVQNAFDEHRRATWYPGLRVFQEAIGAMAEWRSSLLFLSRLVHRPDHTGSGSRSVPALDAPRQEVIDAAIREIMRGKHPSLGHRMLAAVGGLLRLDIILTTNFDDLLEQAFSETHSPLTVFEVHLNSPLPPWSALSHHRALVKLHGDRHSMRADYSLDALPTDTDQERFLDYFLSADGRQLRAMGRTVTSETPLSTLQNHLLVMGFSAADGRIRSFINHAWTHLGRDFKVFWLCHTKQDVDNVSAFTASFRPPDPVPDPTPVRSIVLRSSDHGLLFLQLFQTLRRGLPASGVIFPSAARLTVPPFPRVQHKGPSSPKPATNDTAGHCPAETEPATQVQPLSGTSTPHKPAPGTTDGQPVRPPPNPGGVARPMPPEWVAAPLSLTQPAGIRLREAILNKLTRLRASDSHAARLVVVTSQPGTRGVTSVCAEVFQKLVDDSEICLWVEMNDISATDDLFSKLLDAANYRLGIDNWVPVFVAESALARAEELNRLTSSTNKPWVIFLNARETPGANVNDDAGSSPAHPGNAWMDKEAAEEKETTIVEFLQAIASPACPSISVVLLCRQPTNEPPPLVERLTRDGIIDKAELPLGDCIQIEKDCPIEPSPVEAVLRWTCGEESRLRFLHALVLMQRTRYLATIWDAAFSVPDPPDGANTLTGWLDDLEDCGLVRRKTGGFVWLHSPLRNQLRCILGKTSYGEAYLQEHPDLAKLLASWPKQGELPRIHGHLSQWYRRILLASEARPAVFEAVYHACRGAEAVLSGGGDLPALRDAATRIEEAASLVGTHSFLLQTHGDSRGSCKHLEYIRDTLCKLLNTALARHGTPDPKSAPDLAHAHAAIRETTGLLRIRCTEVMRAIAREVGEDGKAYVRHREVRALLAGKDTTDQKDTTAEKLYESLIEGSGRQSIESHMGDGHVEWMRWWRWSGMLGIASRSYSGSRRALLSVLFFLTERSLVVRGKAKPFPTGQGPDDSTVTCECEKIIELCKDQKWAGPGQPPRDWQQFRIEVARLVEEIVAQRLQDFSLARRLNAEWQPADKPAKLSNLIGVGVTIVNQILARDQSSDAHTSVAAMWCKSRLLMHASICTVLQSAARRGADDHRWNDSMRILADAEACLTYHDPRRHGTDRVIIDLYRAEVRLLQADATAPWAGSASRLASLTFGKMRRTLQEKPEPADTMLWRTRGQSLLREFLPNDEVDRGSVSKGLQKVKALVQDAMRFLTRVEHGLFTRRRNVWWTTWFIERKLKAIAMSVWATVFESGTPVPFLGLEAAPAGASTGADSLLEESCRLIRADAYRLATIIEQYGACASGLHVRLMLDPTAMRLPERQTQMHEHLVRAFERLEAVKRQRDNWEDFLSTPPGSEEQKQRGSVDEGVKHYVSERSESGKEMRKLVAALEHPLTGEFVSQEDLPNRLNKRRPSAAPVGPAAPDANG